MTDALAREFWDGCAAGEIRVRRCDACGAVQTFPQEICPGCSSHAIAWHPSGGQGTVYSLTVVTRAPTDAFRPLVPYTIVLVDLDDGPRMMAHGASGLAIGERVRATFFLHDGRHLPRFVPI